MDLTKVMRIVLTVIAGAALVGAVGCGSNDQQGVTRLQPAGGQMPQGLGTPRGPGGSGGPLPAGAQPANPAATPPGQAGKPAKPAGPTPGGPPPGGINPDPFRATWRQAPPPPYVFSQVPIIRLAPAGVQAPPPKDTEVREVPTRRVSGILTGNGAFAILEGAGEPEIVRPGGMTSDGYRVVSITSDSVRLERKLGPVTYTQVVPLSDAPAGAGGGNGPGAGGPGAGGPGRGGPPGGLPGAGGGGGGGAG